METLVTYGEPVTFFPQKVVYEGNRLTIHDSTTEQEWRAIGQTLGRVQRGAQFWIGDYVLFGERKGFHISGLYNELETITGIPRKTLQNCKQIAEATSSRRREDLKFSHHAEVAALPENTQIEYLQRAADEKWSVRRLRQEVRKSTADRLHAEVQNLLMVSRRLEDERDGYEATVTRIVEEINSMPMALRAKIKKLVVWK